MRKYIVIKIVALLLIAQTGFSQTGAAAQMTPAEYQEFISMLVKAKKKRMAKKRAAYYQQYYASQPPAPLQQQQPVAQAPPQIIEKPAPVNTETAEKIKALEEVQNRLMVQVQQDESNKSAYDSIEIQLQNQLVDLRQQLSEEQFQARQNELEWQRKLQEQQLAESRRSIETVTAPVIVDNGERKSDDQLYAERHRAIQRQVSEIRAQQQTQLRDNNSLKSDLALLQERLKSLNKQLEKQPAANNRNDNSKEIDRLRAEINAQKRLIETSSNGRSDAEVLALQSKVKSLEAQNAQFLLLMQNNDSSNDSMVIKKVVIDTIRIAEQNATNPDTSLMLLVEQMAEMEKQLAEKNKMSSENKNAQSELVKTLQDRITQLEAELKKKPTPAPPIVKVIPAPIPEKAPIEEFITKHRQENVYFDNGSYNLNSLQREKVATIATWLDTYELLDINVKGFASNVGSRTVNERISRKRAQSVKETLVKMGVAGDRIIIQPLGIDATSTDPANARRAEIHLFVRGM